MKGVARRLLGAIGSVFVFAVFVLVRVPGTVCVFVLVLVVYVLVIVPMLGSAGMPMGMGVFGDVVRVPLSASPTRCSFMT